MPTPVRHRRQRRSGWLVLGVALSSVALGAPAALAQGVAGAVGTGAGVSTSVPSGTTLRVGDQLNGLHTLLSADDQANFGFTISWSNFLGGPPMLQAFQAGAIDVGIVGTTPPIFAQAAGQQIVAVAAFGTANSDADLVTAPGVHITSWKQLEGKSVTYQQGTVSEAIVLAGLHSVGLKLSDIKTVNLPVTEATASLENHSADAGILDEPLTDAYLQQNPTAKLVQVAPGLSARLTYIIASKAAIADPAKRAAIATLLAHLVKSEAWTDTHEASYAELEYVKQYGLPASEANKLITELGKTTFYPITSALYQAQQTQANLFTAAGEIPSHVDVGPEFDPVFNGVVEQALKSSSA